MNDQSKILQDLSDFIAIQSVSSDPQRKNEIEKAANFLKTKLEGLGFTVRLIRNTEPDDSPSSPLVYAERIIDTKAKTIGIYGHYDVQPEDPVEEWKTPPFKLSQRDGKLFGRGVADDKGHVLQNIVALESLISQNKLKANMICLLEGEEEIGSVYFEEYLSQVISNLKKVNVFYVIDMGIYQKDIPQIYYGLRGLVYFELEITTGTRDLHSGSYGNRVLNAAMVAAQLFTKMKDPTTHRVLIPGFYDDILEPTQKEIDQLMKIARSDEEEKSVSGAFGLIGVKGVEPYLSPKILPSLDINGIVSGFTGDGAKTIIPNKALVKFSCRLVPQQESQKIINIVGEFIEKSLPNGAHSKLKMLSSSTAFYTHLDDPYLNQTCQILKEFFGHEVAYGRSGGSIPAAEILQRLTHKPIILTGFILPDNNLHSPNENYDEEMFWKGIEALEKIYEAF